MKHIGNLHYAEGSRKARKRIGRGEGSGHGGTSTRGHKGHQSRGNFRYKRNFEGGQMPLSRRIPKFGFVNPFRVEYQEVNVGRIEELVQKGRLGTEITPEELYRAGAISKRNAPVKILGDGQLSHTLTIVAHRFSATAKEKITAAGGQCVVIEQ
ncbi:MAG: 50S ribosomal protein L15 [Bacteroidota bacterium]|nr:50S ribosomal protein L15 [Candidatus Kapabacteria bacterium]MCS7302359.1 50S ribosomal protein L15 [Candidatus Kapabacteria bacterium]MCX7936896.1 50S ribosomal protein L15 [Chlorobiota bacterium]MDW8075325.1 50S ribosomal protein L15 [Bacteroidota bacterium]MDW8271937.1 50S ribosomal protein L15 [Bacteroidota bacterium]